MVRYYAFFNSNKVCYKVQWFEDTFEKLPPSVPDGDYVKEVDTQTYNLMQEYKLDLFTLDDDQNVVNAIPFLEFKLTDSNGNTVSSIKRSEDFTLTIDLTDTSGNDISLNGSYVVPYFSIPDGRQKGAVKVDISNGHGEATINVPFSGIFTIRLRNILNIDTMKIPDPLPLLKDGFDFKFAVYD